MLIVADAGRKYGWVDVPGVGPMLYQEGELVKRGIY